MNLQSKALSKLIVMMALIFTTFAGQVMAGDDSPKRNDVDSIFAGGDSDKQFEFERFGDENIFASINEEMELVCNDGLCTLTAIHEKYNDFEVSFQLGEGYQGGYNSGGGTIIDLGNNGSNDGDDSFWGLRVAYNIGQCEQSIKIPKALYIVMNRYIYGLLTEEGDTRMNFTPADEAMIMFYTTISKQLSGCTRSS